MIEIVSRADRAIVSVMILEEEVLMSANLCVLWLEMLQRLDFVRQVSASSFLVLIIIGLISKFAFHAFERLFCS